MGIVLVLLVLVMIGGAIAFVAVDNRNSAPDPLKSPQYRELRRTLQAVKEIAENHRDVDPVFADVILSEITKHERKELG